MHTIREYRQQNQNGRESIPGSSVSGKNDPGFFIFFFPPKEENKNQVQHTHRDTFTMGQSVRLGGQQQQELCLSWHARDENRGGGGIEGRDSKLSSKDWPMYGSWLQFTVHGIVSLHWSRFQGECEFLPLRGPVSFYSHCRSVKNRALVHVQETRTITSEKAKRERKNTTISSCFTRKLRPFASEKPGFFSLSAWDSSCVIKYFILLFPFCLRISVNGNESV